MNRMNKMIRNLAGLLVITLTITSSIVPVEASSKVKAKYSIDGYTSMTVNILNLKATRIRLVVLSLCKLANVII